MLLGSLPAPSASAASSRGSPASSLAELIERADRASLHESSGWRALLHYESDLLWAVAHSHAGPDFWLARDGSHDPRSELHATLAGFFEPDPRPDNISEAGDVEHPQCRFIARRYWLSQELEIDRDRLPQRSCEHYRAWRDGLGAVGLTLVYPEGFMNNPASMFGHTLIRIGYAVVVLLGAWGACP